MAQYPKNEKRASKPSPRPNTSGGKRNNHNAGVKKALKAARQAEAKARQSEYDNLSATQKVEALDKLGLKATKVRAKLAPKVEAEKAEARTPTKTRKAKA